MLAARLACNSINHSPKLEVWGLGVRGRGCGVMPAAASAALPDDGDGRVRIGVFWTVCMKCGGVVDEEVGDIQCMKGFGVE